jgi:glutaredoxin
MKAVLGWLLRRLGGAARQRPDLAVLVYSRQGCHLCDEAWEQLLLAQRRYGFQLEKVDVDTDASLAAQYGECVPVVLVNGKVRFRGRVNPVLLEKLLEGPA